MPAQKSLLPDGITIGEFKPCAIEFREIGLTTYVHEDVAYHAKPMTGLHWVDALLANDDGRLVGVNFWFTRTRKASLFQSIKYWLRRWLRKTRTRD